MFAPGVWFKSWLRRWLQIEHTATMHGQVLTMEQAVRDTVESARLGDQISMALIMETKKSAEAGEPTAIRALKLIDQYTAHNEHGNLNHFDVSVGEDEACDLATALFGEDYAIAVFEKVPAVAAQSRNKAIVTLANGPSLLPGADGVNRVRQVGEKFKDEDTRQAFITGTKHQQNALELMSGLDHDAQHALFLGYIIGAARCIQAVRIPEIPISAQNVMVGWELGE